MTFLHICNFLEKCVLYFVPFVAPRFLFFMMRRLITAVITCAFMAASVMPMATPGCEQGVSAQRMKCCCPDGACTCGHEQVHAGTHPDTAGDSVCSCGSFLPSKDVPAQDSTERYPALPISSYILPPRGRNASIVSSDVFTPRFVNEQSIFHPPRDC
jgi:hypothetical protein